MPLLPQVFFRHGDAVSYRYDTLLRLLAERLGGLDTYERPDGMGIEIRLHDDNSTHRLNYTTIMMAHDPQARIIAWVLEILNGRLLDESRKYVGDTIEKEGSILSARVQRIQDINDELDVIRGRVPTPKGYKVDLDRARNLMAELKQLMAE